MPSGRARTASPAPARPERDITGRQATGALAAAPLVTLYKQYVVRFGLGYREEVKPDVQIAGHAEPVRMHFAQPMGPIPY